MQEITKQSFLEAFQEEKQIALDNFTDKDKVLVLARKAKGQKTSDFTKVVCAKLRLSPIC